jgi:hypothetical protein
VRAATRTLISERMILSEDEDVVVEAAGERWDRVLAAWSSQA